MSTPREDSNLFLLAVQQGELTQTQIDDCLRAWQNRHEQAAAKRALHEVAVDKGYLSQAKVDELQQKIKSPEAAAGSRVSAVVVLACPKCRKERPLGLDTAVARPLCPTCSVALEVPDDGPPSVTLKINPMPPEVEKRAADPANVFGKYVLLERLGAGGMGEVVKAWDSVLQRPVAIKFPREGSGDVQRMYTEARGAGRLSHPNIAAVYEAGEISGRPYIAMQFIDGRTADDARAAAEREKGIPEIVRWVRDAAYAAHYAHCSGVIHRDFKPSNLMVDRDGRVYVMDFGLAKLTTGSAQATVSGMILGTPSFMPPEQASGRADKVDVRSDVYSLGATLYVLLTGKKPYEGDSATDILVRILTVDPVPLRQVRSDLPWEREAIAEKAMRRNAEDRYASAKELADDLGRFLGEEPVRAKPASVTYRLRKKYARHLAVIGASTVAGLLAVALVATLILRPDPPPAPRPAPDREPAWRALYGPLQKALASDGFDAVEAGRLRAVLEKEFPERKAQLDAWLEQEHRLVTRALEELPRDRWLASSARVRGYRDWLAFNGRPTAAADRILAWRGTCRLQIHVQPWALLKGPGVDALPEADRATPLWLKMDVVDGDLELSHPAYGTRKVRLEGLQDGAAYVIEGDWKEPGRIALRRDE